MSSLVADFLARRAEGESELTCEEVCGDHPDLLEDVRRAVDLAGALPALHAIAATPDALVGSMLTGRYRVDRRRGSGAMGVVYAGTDLDLGRRVAIKIVHTRFLAEGEALARFDREAAALAAISHESIVTIFDRGTTDTGAPFLVMELIDGVPCSEVLLLAQPHLESDETNWLGAECGIEGLRETSLVRQMVSWVASLANGLEAAHAAGVFHRDVKPSNIIIRRDGCPVLLDFGIASREDDEPLTRTISAVGTPAYMAPESLLSGHKYPRAGQDVYGLAATLHHLLTSVAPYSGTPTSILAALATRDPIPASKLRLGLPRDAQAILDHGLARSPKQRYATPASMEEDLRAFLAFQPIGVRPTGPMTRAFRRVRRSKMAVGGLLATLLIVGTLGALEVSEIWEKGRKRVYDEVLLHLPANLGVVGPANRTIADNSLRSEVAGVLDRLVESGYRETVARALRASFRLDHGDVDGAKVDIRVAASAVGSAYANELALRYEALPDTSHSAFDLDLEDLPELTAPMDPYLAGLHAMRTGRYSDAIPLLASESLEDVRHAQELSVLLMTLEYGPLKRAGKGAELFVAVEAVFKAALEIETRWGASSAMTAHIKAAGRNEQKRYPLCLALCDEAVALAPASHVTLQNAIEASIKLGLDDRARSYLSEAQAVVPTYLPFSKFEWDLKVRAGDYPGALQVIDDANFGAGSRAVRQRSVARAQVLLEEALETRESNQERCFTCAQEALQELSSLPEDSSLRVDLSSTARACLEESTHPVFRAVLDQCAAEPMSADRLRLALRLWPEDLDSGSDLKVRAYMESMSELLTLSGIIGERRPTTK